MTSSIGRIVHYVDYDGRHIAAMIVQLADEDTNEERLAIFDPYYTTTMWRDASQDAECGLTTWHEPERV